MSYVYSTLKRKTQYRNRPHFREELQPHFARGAAVYVAPDLDLIAVARHVAEDEAAPLKQWMEQGKFGAISDDMARTFLADKQEMWAVVVAPWVLVQPCKD